MAERSSLPSFQAASAASNASKYGFRLLTICSGMVGWPVLLEPAQKALLDQILEQPLLSLADLGLAPDNGDELDEDSSDGAA